MSCLPEPERKESLKLESRQGLAISSVEGAGDAWKVLETKEGGLTGGRFEDCMQKELGGGKKLSTRGRSKPGVLYKMYVNTNSIANLAPLIAKSPLQEVARLDSTAIVTSLSDKDRNILREIASKATLIMKFFAIPETMYAQEETSWLYSYVETQLQHAGDVVTPKQAKMILKLIESGVAQGSMLKKETGPEGSLKNSMVVAILTEHKGNVHFMMAGLSLEPKLGWRLIMPLTSLCLAIFLAFITNGPFEKWGIDAMGPLPRTANGKLYILVAIDYMTRFGTPLEIVSNNGTGFRRGLLTEVCEELKISHRHSTPYYPQSNGLVEKANGIIAGIIRKMVESKPKRWDNFLDGAIWAYRTTYRDATQFTPFHLVYGQEALQPIELNIPTIKLTGRQEQSNDEAWIDRLLNLVELEWKREAAYQCYEKKALQLKDKLNEGIKDKEIKEKSLVLRYNNALDNRFDAKFERRWEGPFIVKKAFTGGYYQLMDLNGKEHPRKVNGYWLKPYLSRILPAVFETKQVSKKTKKVCCHCCSGTHQVKSCAFQHVLHEVAKDQKEKLSSPTSCPESSFQYNPVDGT
ncbi:hypothetical protein L7F22_034884 [Adiantum nelumboides]|nr:hypothetical protein [Adiantum nelumboides]